MCLLMQQLPARRISAEASVPLVLVVDDNDDDLVLFRRAVRQIEYSGIVNYLGSGSQAIAYLAGEGDFGDRTRFPAADLLILDLKMPGTSGFDVLAWLQQHGGSPVRTAVLTTSDDRGDITRAYALGAGWFLAKANSFTEFKESVGALLAYFGDYYRYADDSDRAGFAPRAAGTLSGSLENA